MSKPGSAGTDYSRSLAAALAATGVTGASFAYWDGDCLHTAVAGLRNSVTGDPVTLDTVMHIGSISKLLNTVLMMQLVDEGKIALDDPVLRHLPDLRLADMDALRKMSCSMLVNHTSGIDGVMLADHGPDQERIVDAIGRCAQLGQLHPPGGGPSYCNIATVIAGYLAQRLRGVSWYTLIKAKIYEPLGMQHALADLTELPRFRASIGDVTDPATGTLVQSTRPFLPLSFAPCGTTLMTSAADLVNFGRALVNGGVGMNGTRILSAAAAVRMASPTCAIIEPVGWHWGLGWILLPNGLLYHSGGGPGVASTLYAQPETGRVLALLTNCDRGHSLRPHLVDPIIGSWIRTPEPVATGAPGAIDFTPYVGVYENNMFQAEVLAIDSGIGLRMTLKARLYDNSQLSAAPIIPLNALGNDAFEGAILPGIAATGVRFCQPGRRGSMQALGFMLHLLVRTQ
jgi:CubicO group peptidase (beta-lactamase class C family)